MLRYHNGTTQQWSLSTGWTDTDLAKPCAAGGSDGTLTMLPQSSASGQAKAGATTVAINALSTFAPNAVGKIDWFAPGQQVVIDPGGSNQELATIANVNGALSFTTPVQHAHDAGEMISATGPPSTEVRSTGGGRGSQSGSGNGSGALPFTGARMLGLLAAALLFLAVGFGVSATTGRRRRLDT